MYLFVFCFEFVPVMLMSARYFHLSLCLGILVNMTINLNLDNQAVTERALLHPKAVCDFLIYIFL